MNSKLSRGRFALLAAALLAVAWPAEARAGEPLLLSDPRRDATVTTVEQVLPGLVNIATTELRQVSDWHRRMIMELNGQRPIEKRLSIGSGAIIDEEGYVLTADHVVRSATEIWVKLADGRERQADQIILTSRSDVALLKIRTLPGDKFTPIRLAADDDLLLGETTLSLGNPYGLGGSVSRGILSSKNRRPPPEAEQLGPGDWLQTDAAINPGSSGGPLVNLRGELIGLNAAVFSGAQGIGFAIPIRAVTDSVSGLLSPETRGFWFGAQVKPRRGAASELPGVIVAEVERGSPADRAGLQVGDVIMGINGKTPRSFMQFSMELVFAAKPESVPLVIQRGGGTKTLTVQMIEQKSIFNSDLVRARTGASLIEMTLENARGLGLRQPEGFVVTEVEVKSPAAEAKLPRGVVVTGLDGRPAGSLIELARSIASRKAGEIVTFNFVALHQQQGLLFQESKKARIKLR